MRNMQAWRWFVVALVASDSILLGLASALALRLRATLDALPSIPDFDPNSHALVAVLAIPALLLLFRMRGAYDHQRLLGGPDEYVRVISACTYSVVLVVAASFFNGSQPLVSRGWLLLFWSLAILLVSAGRFTLRRVAYQLRHHGWFIRRVIVAGASDQGMSIAAQLHRPLDLGVELVGLLDDFLPVGTRLNPVGQQQISGKPGAFRVIGHPRDAYRLVAESGADLLIVVPASLGWESQQFFAELSGAPRGLEVRLAPTHWDLSTSGVEPAPLGYVPLFRLLPGRITGVEEVLRAGVDVILTLLLLLILAPVAAWTLCAAWLRGIRPILVHQDVVGEGGRPVRLSLLNPKVSDRLLVRGMPALLSVLGGDLALVGPSPVPIENRAAYERWAGVLFGVKPGLTGPWRLTRSAIEPTERILGDVWWVRNWTIWQHLFVLFQTSLVVLGRWRGEVVARWRDESRPQPRAVSWTRQV